ncbi:leukemia-associated protein 7 [Cetorhinus maximus]
MQSVLHACIAHQQCALTTLHQYLQDQRHLGPQQPRIEQHNTDRNSSQPGSSTQEPVPSTKRRTILQVARESRLTRFIGFTSQLLDLEQNSLSQLQEPRFHAEAKLSTELRNLCNRMATREDCLQFDADLKAIEQCLRDIVNQLSMSLSSQNSGSDPQTIHVLKRLVKRVLDM